MARWLMFCEAAADHRTATTLIDRALRHQCESWVAEQPDARRDDPAW